MNKAWTTLSTKIAFHCPFYEVKEDKVKYPHDKIVTQWVLSKKDFSLIIPLSADNLDTYVVKQYRYTVKEAVWSFPAGGIEEGEGPLEAAKRELSEETGIVADKWEKIGEFYVAPGHSSQKAIVYLARSLKEGNSHPEEDEDITVKKITVREFYDLAKKGEVTDGPTLSALLLLEKNNI